MSSNSKLFAEDTALFSFVRYKNLKAKDLNENLQEISNWVIQWKMNFHPDPPKQAQESIFPRKYSETSHSVLLFNSNHIQESSLRKHLGIILDSNYIKDILQLYPLKCIRP